VKHNEALGYHTHIQQSSRMQKSIHKIKSISIHKKNEQSDKEIRKAILFTIASKIIRAKSKFNRNIYKSLKTEINGGIRR
jgi:hypothetical protein